MTDSESATVSVNGGPDVGMDRLGDEVLLAFTGAGIMESDADKEPEPVPMRKRLFDFLKEQIKVAQESAPDRAFDDLTVQLPAGFVDTLAEQIYRIPDEERTLIVEFGKSERQLIRTALGQHADALEKGAKNLTEKLGHPEMGSRLMADMLRITDFIRPQFNEQREFDLAIPETPQLSLVEQQAVRDADGED